jgi:hypothetical protein
MEAAADLVRGPEVTLAGRSAGCALGDPARRGIVKSNRAIRTAILYDKGDCYNDWSRCKVCERVTFVAGILHDAWWFVGKVAVDDCLQSLSRTRSRPVEVRRHDQT